MTDIESLLAPVAGPLPCGPDLGQDAAYLALAQAARGKPEHRMGDSVVAAEQADWGAVRSQAEGLLARSKDLRVAVLLARALVRVDNLTGLRDALTLLHGLLERFWEQVHPVPDPTDPDDLITRLNTLDPLTDPDALLQDVRAALVVAAGPHGRISVRDILVAAGRLPTAAGETVPSQAQIDAAIAAAATEDPDAIGAAAASTGLAGAIGALLTEKVGSGRGPDLRPLTDLLKPVVLACRNAAAAAPNEAQATPAPANDTPAPVAATAPTPETTPAPTPAPAAAPAGTRAPGEIASREDAMQALDSVCRFYERTEPGNPAPLLIRRAQRLINKTFVELLQDLAPDGLAQVRTVAGLKNE